jgi:phospholipase C
MALIAAASVWTMLAANAETAVGMPAPESPAPSATGIDKLDHLIFIVQENRSFDHYFGMYPGADGLPRRPDGRFTTCVPDPVIHRCDQPWHQTNPVVLGGPHSHVASVTSVDRGKMDGFIRAALASPSATGYHCTADRMARDCRDHIGPQRQPDMLSYFTRREIPNYWTYADRFVLQDHMYESVDSWSLPSHMFLTSGWAATCSDPRDPMSCRSDPQVSSKSGPYPWTDITYLLHEAGVSWSYYVGDGTNLTCADWPCPAKDKATATARSWMPIRGFLTLKEDAEIDNVRRYSQFLASAADGTLPSVSWVIPAAGVSEHPGRGSMEPGYAYVTDTINAVMNSPEWNSSAIFLTWDDWGGFYDHADPIRIDSMGYGIRVPGLVISPYAKEGFIDSQTLSPDAYLKFIEDRFLAGQRLDPKNDGRPDSRPSVREAEPKLGDVANDFDFTQSPRPPVLLDPNTFGTG